MRLLNLPEPIQPADTTDQLTSFQVSLNGAWLDQVEFECASCHIRYWRGIIGEESYSEVVEVEGIGTYALNPTIRFTYAPSPHVHALGFPT